MTWLLLMDRYARAQSMKLQYTLEKILQGAMHTGTVHELQKKEEPSEFTTMFCQIPVPSRDVTNQTLPGQE